MSIKQQTSQKDSSMTKKQLNIQAHGVVNPEYGVAGVGYIIHIHSNNSKSIPREEKKKIALGGINDQQAALLSIQHALNMADRIGGEHIELQTPCEYPPKINESESEQRKIQMYVDTIEDLRDRFEVCEIQTIPVGKTRATTLAHEATRN